MPEEPVVHRFDPRPEPVPPCRGLCRGDRPAWDSPAKFGHLADGTRVIWCPCHQGVLKRISHEDYASQVAAGRFMPDVIPAGASLFTDDICFYDVVAMREVKERD